MEITIENTKIGPNHSPYIIAELSANHGGSLERALRTVDAAHRANASAIKLQSYTPDTITLDCNEPDFQIHGGLWDGYNLHQLYQKAHTPFEWHEAIFNHAHSLGMTVFSSPFDHTAVDLLEELNAPAYKIASFELLDIPLIRYVARTGKPMIMSTGMADEQEIAEAVEAAQTSGCSDIILLHCISSYPTPIERANLRRLPKLAEHFNVMVGLSDHTMGTTAAVAAVSLGACLVEKHFTLSRDEPGPDSTFSMEPDEFAKLCADTRDAWSALGDDADIATNSDDENKSFRRSIYFVRDITAGSVITEQDIRSIRPGFGLAPKYYDDLIGKTVRVDVKRGTATNWDQIAGNN